MKTISCQLLVASLFAVLCLGCSQSDNTSNPTGQPVSSSEKTELVEEPIQQEVEPPLTEEEIAKIAAAKQFATDLGIVMKEDSQGNVISLDTAANRSWVDDFQMQEVLIFPKLESLVLEGPSITDQLAPQLAQLSKLTSLKLSGTLIGDDGLESLLELKQLKIIDLRLSPMLTDAGVATLAKMQQLRAVRLSGCNITDAGLETILSLPQLSELDIRNCRKLTAAGIEKVSAKSSLRNLKIGGELIDDSLLAVISKMQGLQGLSLDNCNITDAGTKHLENLSLVDLTLYQAPNVTDAGLQFLIFQENLKKLTLRDIAAQGKALVIIPQPELLVSLNLAQSGMTDGEIPNLERFSKLTTLILNETKITDTAIETLVKMKSLKRIEMTQTGITQAAADRLKKALPDCNVRIN